MLEIEVPGGPESWDEVSECFIIPDSTTLKLEHSLVSISKWESRWHKPFLTTQGNMTDEETIHYIKCMTLTQNVADEVFERAARSHICINKIAEYINNPMTATTFREEKGAKSSREIVTSELIYYWMFESGIPIECQKWHLNRLLTVIRVCSVKRQPPKKRSKRDIMSSNAALNAARRAQLNTKG